jgi:acetyl esterase/lipase
MLLFSPEVDLELDEPSVTENAARDILPWNIPRSAYRHGGDPRGGIVSAVDADLSGFPPTFVSWGGDEMFRDAIRRYVARLDRAEVVRVAHEEPGMYHVFPIVVPWAQSSRRVHEAVGAFVHARFADAPVLDARVLDDQPRPARR